MAIPKAGPEPLLDLAAFLEPVGRLVRRWESRRAMERYATGLLSGVDRKTASGLGRSLPGTSGQNLQEFLTRTRWDPWAMDQLRIEHMLAYATAGDGVLIVDDTGLPKKGTASVGVARQYSGTLGRVDNSQVVVTAHYVDRVFDWPVTARLYLPQRWAEDPKRRRRAQVPESVSFKTKGELALELIERARASQVPFRVVVVDAGYGDQPALLDGMVAREIPHVAAVSESARFRVAVEVDQDPGDEPPPPYNGCGRPRKAKALKDRIVSREAGALIDELPAEAWHRVAWRDGTKGPLVKEFALIEVFRSGLRGEHLPVRGLLLGERPIGKANQTEKRKYYFTWGLSELTLAELVDLAHIRWVIERFYQDAKGELGLDHYEGRLWPGFHRHVALVMLAHSYLALRQSYAPEATERPPPKRPKRVSAEVGLPVARGFPPTREKKRRRLAQDHT
jgi:SRSO17 transposase